VIWTIDRSREASGFWKTGFERRRSWETWILDSQNREMIMVVDRGGRRTIGSGLEKDQYSGFWGFEKEKEDHCITIPQITKFEGFKGVALGHRDGSHGGGLREEP
jgi:hypothetical protein